MGHGGKGTAPQPPRGVRRTDVHPSRSRFSPQRPVPVAAATPPTLGACPDKESTAAHAPPRYAASPLALSRAACFASWLLESPRGPELGRGFPFSPTPLSFLRERLPD